MCINNAVGAASAGSMQSSVDWEILITTFPPVRSYTSLDLVGKHFFNTELIDPIRFRSDKPTPRKMQYPVSWHFVS